MTCTGCEDNLTFALVSRPGVEQARADHRAKTVEVTFNPALTDEAALRQAIEDMGYRLAT